MKSSAVCALSLLLFASASAAQTTTLDEVLTRAGAYVTDFHQQLSGIVAEEHYVQDVRTPPRRPLVMPVLEHRELRSDLLIVRPGGGREWLQFRDVFEVDGTPVRDRDERLARLFLQPPPSANAQVADILTESARYNIGRVTRTLNTPVLALMFLAPNVQTRFKFKRTDARTPAAMARANETTPGRFRAGTEIWVVQYEEKARPTVVRNLRKKDVPSRGRFWIEPDTGRVLMTELVVEDPGVRGTIDVSYQSEPLLGLSVPVEMRERYDVRDRSQIDGSATYGRFRQFQVHVDEKIGPIKK